MTYPGSNTSAAWYQDNYPGSAMRTNCGVIHTTEGTSLPGYSGGATAPNYTAVPDFGRKRLRFFQHYPDNRSSRALRNTAGGVETNTANALQLELVGTCAPGTRDAWKRTGRPFIFWPAPPTWALNDLAKFMAWHKDHTGIPLDGPSDARWKPYPESYGSGGQRFTFAEWRSFRGWCGHQHVPENLHGDPGDFPFSNVLSMAKKIANEPSPREKAKVLATPRWDDLWELADAIADDYPKLPEPKQIKALAAKYSSKH